MQKVVDAIIEQIYQAVEQFLDDLHDVFFPQGDRWIVVFFGVLVGQGPIQQWELGTLDAISRFRSNVASAIREGIQSAIISAAKSALLDKRFSSRVIRVDVAVGYFLDELLVGSQNTALFNPGGLTKLIGRLEHRIGSPLRKILKIARGEQFISGLKILAGVIAAGVVLILEAGGALALILLAAKVLDDATRNPRHLLKDALRQDSKRISIECSTWNIRKRIHPGKVK